MNAVLRQDSHQLSLCALQNAMPLSSAIFKSEHKNPVPQCPPRLDVQTINAVLWSRMPNSFLKVETARVNERHGWVVQCMEPLQMLAVHIPEENRCETRLSSLISWICYFLKHTSQCTQYLKCLIYTGSFKPFLARTRDSMQLPVVTQLVFFILKQKMY